MTASTWIPYEHRLVKRNTAARILGVSAQVVGQMAKRGDLEPVQSGTRERRYRLAEVVALRDRLDELEREAPGQEAAP